MPSKPFQFGGEAVVLAKEFAFAGSRYAKAQPFPYKGLGVIEFDLRGLWLADLIEFTGKPYGVAGSTEHSDAELERLTAPAGKQAPAKQQAAAARR